MDFDRFAKFLKDHPWRWDSWDLVKKTVEAQKDDLSDADLSGSELSDADLSGANLSGANLSAAEDLGGATMPSGAREQINFDEDGF